MLKPIKTFYVEGIPDYEEYCKARDIASNEDCVVEVRWLPSIWAGWFHEYVFANSNPADLAAKTPRVYGV